MNKGLTAVGALVMASIAAGCAGPTGQHRMSNTENREHCEATTYRSTHSSTQSSAINGVFNIGRSVIAGWNPGLAAESAVRGIVNGTMSDGQRQTQRAAAVERCVLNQQRLMQR